MDLGTVLTAAVAIIGLLLGVVGWFAQHNFLRIENTIAAMVEASTKAHTADVESRARERHDLRNEIHLVSAKLEAFKLEAVEKFVNTAEFNHGLQQALGPITAGLARLENTIDKLFAKLDAKQDKGGDD